jgi:hypothetical protein
LSIYHHSYKRKCLQWIDLWNDCWAGDLRVIIFITFPPAWSATLALVSCNYHVAIPGPPDVLLILEAGHQSLVRSRERGITGRRRTADGQTMITDYSQPLRLTCWVPDSSARESWSYETCGVMK